jgi:hypothetical protein
LGEWRKPTKPRDSVRLRPITVVCEFALMHKAALYNGLIVVAWKFTGAIGLE